MMTIRLSDLKLLRGRRGNRHEICKCERQQDLQETVLKFVGILDSGRPDRAEKARFELKERIARRIAR